MRFLVTTETDLTPVEADLFELAGEFVVFKAKSRESVAWDLVACFHRPTSVLAEAHVAPEVRKALGWEEAA